MNPEVPDNRFPPASWTDRQVLDWLVFSFTNHLVTHKRVGYTLIIVIGMLAAALIGLIHF